MSWVSIALPIITRFECPECHEQSMLKIKLRGVCGSEYYCCEHCEAMCVRTGGSYQAVERCIGCRQCFKSLEEPL